MHTRIRTYSTASYGSLSTSPRRSRCRRVIASPRPHGSRGCAGGSGGQGHALLTSASSASRLGLAHRGGSANSSGKTPNSLGSLCTFSTPGAQQPICFNINPALMEFGWPNTISRNGNPLQYSHLENPTDRGAWQATVYRVTRVRHD